MSLEECEIAMEAARLIEVDKNMNSHRLSFLNFAVQATDKKGKPVYKTFSDWYDYKSDLKGDTNQKSDKFSRLIEYKRKKDGKL